MTLKEGHSSARTCPVLLHQSPDTTTCRGVSLISHHRIQCCPEPGKNIFAHLYFLGTDSKRKQRTGTRVALNVKACRTATFLSGKGTSSNPTGDRECLLLPTLIKWAFPFQHASRVLPRSVTHIPFDTLTPLFRNYPKETFTHGWARMNRDPRRNV